MRLSTTHNKRYNKNECPQVRKRGVKSVVHVSYPNRSSIEMELCKNDD